jgi:hypothetical protein
MLRRTITSCDFYLFVRAYYHHYHHHQIIGVMPREDKERREARVYDHVSSYKLRTEPEYKDS